MASAVVSRQRRGTDTVPKAREDRMEWRHSFAPMPGVRLYYWVDTEAEERATPQEGAEEAGYARAA